MAGTKPEEMPIADGQFCTSKITTFKGSPQTDQDNKK
jgi:hypothetical protein